jgi:hypothetical protein
MTELYKYGTIVAYKKGDQVLYVNEHGIILLEQRYESEEAIKAWRPDIIATVQILDADSRVQYA